MLTTIERPTAVPSNLQNGAKVPTDPRVFATLVVRVLALGKTETSRSSCPCPLSQACAMPSSSRKRRRSSVRARSDRRLAAPPTRPCTASTGRRLSALTPLLSGFRHRRRACPSLSVARSAAVLNITLRVLVSARPRDGSSTCAPAFRSSPYLHTAAVTVPSCPPPLFFVVHHASEL